MVPCSTRFHRQARLGPIKGLNLALLIHAQHEGVFRRIEIKPHYVLELVNEMWGSTQLEGTNSVWLEPVGFPDAMDTGRTQTYHWCQASRAPMRGGGRLLPKRPLHNLTHLGLSNSPLASRSTPVLKQTCHPSCLIAITPAADCWSSRAQLTHDLPRGCAIGAEQHDTRPESHLLRCIPIPYHLLQIYPILITHSYSSARSHETQYIISNAI